MFQKPISLKSMVSFIPSYDVGSLFLSNVSRAVHSYSWDANFYLFSSTVDPMLAELDRLSIDEIMRPDKSDGPNSHCCSCLLVWNSVKDYWERLYGSVVYSITKLLIDRECYWALLASRVSELKVVPLLSWSEGFVDFVQYSSSLLCLCGSDASSLLIGASFTLAGL